MEYEDVLPISRRDAEAALASDDPAAISRALLSAAYYDPDWRWVQERCMEMTGHPDPGVRGLAATCLGHLARIHRDLDVKRVREVLRKLRTDSCVAGRADDALSDIRTFVTRPRLPQKVDPSG